MALQRQQLCRGAAAAALAPSLPAVSHHHHVARHSNTSDGGSPAAAAWTPTAPHLLAAPAHLLPQRPLVAARYSNDTSSSASPPAVWMAPSSSMADTEACVKLLGQAYMNHRWCRELQVQPGKEAQLFSGLAHCMLELFTDEPVVLLSSQHAAAAVVLSGEQEAQLVSALQGLDFHVIPGTLQILQAIPEGRLPKLIGLLQDLQQHTAAQGAEQATSGYQKLLCLGAQPGSQGRGAGGELLAAAVAAATAKRVPLYADAADEVAVGMLQRRGFKVVGSSTAQCTQLVLTPL